MQADASESPFDDNDVDQFRWIPVDGDVAPTKIRIYYHDENKYIILTERFVRVMKWSLPDWTIHYPEIGVYKIPIQGLINLNLTNVTWIKEP